jgi:hypothetical protein
MNYRKLLGLLVAALMLTALASGAASPNTHGDSNVRQAIVRTQNMLAAVGRCTAAGEKVCSEGIALAKLAKESAESAARSDDLSSAAKSHVQIAIQRLVETIAFLEQGRSGEAMPFGNNALAALYEAGKSS